MGLKVSDAEFRRWVESGLVTDDAQPRGPAVDCDEETLQAEIIKLAKQRGFLCYHTHDSRRSAAGFPDLFLIRGKKYLFAELKKIGKQPTKEQESWIDALRFAGVPTYVWTSRDWQTICEVLR